LTVLLVEQNASKALAIADHAGVLELDASSSKVPLRP
jgi:ABC-type branched-subunit amino acid transport system ATPase component